MQSTSWVLCGVLAACGSSPPSSIAADAAGPPSQLADSFTVQPGLFQFLHGLDCAKAGNCYGNNPSSPYGLVLVPPAPNTALPPSPLVATDTTGAQCYGQAGCTAALSASYMLDPDEVIAVSGVSPPEVRYWGMTGYVYSRVIGGARDATFGSLGDSVNLATWQSPTGSPFGAPFVLLQGANPSTLATARAAYIAAGTDPAAIITMTIPGGTDTTAFQLGSDPATANEFTFLLRSALPADANAFAAYIDPATVASRFTVLRLTPLNAAGASPQPWPSERVRGSGTAESSTLDSALDDLARAVKRSAAPATPVELDSALTWAALGNAIYQGGEYCYDNQQDCLGDSPDSLYSITTTASTLAGDGSSYYVAIGVDHTATGKSAYTNVSVTETDAPQLAAATAADPSFAGSAQYYFSLANITIDPAIAAQLYAIKFSWSCGASMYCVDLTQAAMAAGAWSGDPPANDYSLSPQARLNVTERAYLDVNTGTGPSHDQLVAPRVIFVH